MEYKIREVKGLDGPWKTLGEMLKELREEKGMSLRELSLAINVDYKKLERMERGDFKNLDVPVYVKGYLRRYADVLGIDSTELIEMYEKGFEVTNVETEMIKEEKEERKKKVNLSLILVIAVLLVNLMFLYMGLKEFSSLIKEPLGIIENLSGDVIRVNGTDLKPGEKLALGEGTYRIEGNKGEVFVRTKGKLWKVRLKNFEVKISWER